MFIIKVILEVAAILLLLYGYLHEEEVAAWERKTWWKIKQHVKRRIRQAKRAREMARR